MRHVGQQTLLAAADLPLRPAVSLRPVMLEVRVTHTLALALLPARPPTAPGAYLPLASLQVARTWGLAKEPPDLESP